MREGKAKSRWLNWVLDESAKPTIAQPWQRSVKHGGMWVVELPKAANG